MLGGNHEKGNNNTELTRRIADSLGLGEVAMNEVDLDDIAVSDTILRTLYHAADSMTPGFAHPGDAPLVSAYWIDDTRELVLCAASLAGLHLVRVPAKSWTLKPCTIH